jgi:hypothetical protein
MLAMLYAITSSAMVMMVKYNCIQFTRCKRNQLLVMYINFVHMNYMRLSVSVEQYSAKSYTLHTHWSFFCNIDDRLLDYFGNPPILRVSDGKTFIVHLYV